MSSLDDLLADALQALGEGPMTWIQHNLHQAQVSAVLYGGIKACPKCRGVLDYLTEQHWCQGEPDRWLKTSNAGAASNVRRQATTAKTVSLHIG